MTPDQIKLNMAVMTPLGKGVVVGWSAPDIAPYLVKIANYDGHDGGGTQLIAGSRGTLKNDGCWFKANKLTAIEDDMTEQTHYPDWQKLTPLPREPRPDEKIGAKFVVVKDGNWHLDQGDIVELVGNDRTSAPYFKRINGSGIRPCNWYRISPLPQPEEKKVKKLVPFTDEFDWCEEGVLVMAGYQERYAVRAKGDFVWVTLKDKIPCSHTAYLTTYDRSNCQKVIHETHRQLTNLEFAEFMQDHKGMVKAEGGHEIYVSHTFYYAKNEDKAVREDLRFRFRGTEEWHQVTTELYDIAKGLDL